MMALDLTSWLQACIEVSTEQVEYSDCLAGYVIDVGFPCQI